MCLHAPESRIVDEGQYVCCACGEILSQHIDESAEWRQYGTDDLNKNMCRSGSGTLHELLPDTSYGSVAMSTKTISPSFNALTKTTMYMFAANSERSWLTLFKNMEQRADMFGIVKSITTDACGILKMHVNTLKVRGETRRALMGAAFFLACTNNGAARSYAEISDLMSCSTRSLAKAVEQFNPLVDVMETQISMAYRMMNYVDLADSHCEDVVRDIRKMFTDPFLELHHTSKSLVASVIARYLDPTSIKSFSKKCGVSVISLQKILDERQV